MKSKFGKQWQYHPETRLSTRAWQRWPTFGFSALLVLQLLSRVYPVEVRLIHRGQRSPPSIKALRYTESPRSGRLCQGLKDYLPGNGQGSDYSSENASFECPRPAESTCY